jgi:hypothetical protein
MCEEKKLRMSDVFILGAGFSKAVSNEMPLMKNSELSHEVFRCFEHHKKIIPPEIKSRLDQDIEKELASLVSDKSRASLYFDLISAIRGVFLSKSNDPRVWKRNSPPHWLENLIAYWHNNHCVVISLNYDTLIECVASVGSRMRPKIPTSELYPIRFTQVATGIESPKVLVPTKTFKLFKLHGSINWFYSGHPDFLGEELFCVPSVEGIDRVFDSTDNANSQLLNGKCPLIVPPVPDKCAFFQHETLRSMWLQAEEALKKADRIVCLGYSLPESDSHMIRLLQCSAPERRVQFEIADRERKDGHFSKILGKDSYEFRQEYETEVCILRFILHNFIQDNDDKVQVAVEIYERRKRLCASAKTTKCG